jgi:tetratricopeptide (TPR) repeat protein
MGGAYKSKGEVDKAIQYYEKAIDILKDFLPESHPDMQTMLGNY